VRRRDRAQELEIQAPLVAVAWSGNPRHGTSRGSRHITVYELPLCGEAKCCIGLRHDSQIQARFKDSDQHATRGWPMPDLTQTTRRDS
jgi:hypothetical protein